MFSSLLKEVSQNGARSTEMPVLLEGMAFSASDGGESDTGDVQQTSGPSQPAMLMAAIQGTVSTQGAPYMSGDAVDEGGEAPSYIIENRSSAKGTVGTRLPDAFKNQGAEILTVSYAGSKGNSNGATSHEDGPSLVSEDIPVAKEETKKETALSASDGVESDTRDVQRTSHPSQPVMPLVVFQGTGGAQGTPYKSGDTVDEGGEAPSSLLIENRSPAKGGVEARPSDAVKRPGAEIISASLTGSDGDGEGVPSPEDGPSPAFNVAVPAEVAASKVKGQVELSEEVTDGRYYERRAPELEVSGPALRETSPEVGSGVYKEEPRLGGVAAVAQRVDSSADGESNVTHDLKRAPGAPLEVKEGHSTRQMSLLAEHLPPEGERGLPLDLRAVSVRAAEESGSSFSLHRGERNATPEGGWLKAMTQTGNGEGIAAGSLTMGWSRGDQELSGDSAGQDLTGRFSAGNQNLTKASHEREAFFEITEAPIGLRVHGEPKPAISEKESLPHNAVARGLDGPGAQAAEPLLFSKGGDSASSLISPAKAYPSESYLGKVVISQVASGILSVRDKGDYSIRVKLQPESLGSLQLEVSLKDKGIRTHLIAQTDEAKLLIESNLPRLRETLNQHGLHLEQFSISVGQEQRWSGGRSNNHPFAGGRQWVRESGAAEVPKKDGHRWSDVSYADRAYSIEVVV